MINPEYKPQWRPQTDLGHHYNLDPALTPLEVYVPKDAADALAYIRESALPELTAYDGYPGQGDLLKEEAATRWPQLFAGFVATQPIIRTPSETSKLPTQLTVREQCIRQDGSTDWNKLAKMTKVVVWRSPLTEAL